MKRMLTNNLGLKLLSVVAAIMLWLIVMNMDDPYTYRDFSPIQVTMLNENVVTDQGKVYRIEDNSDVISIRVSGKKSVLRDLDIEDFTATADMEKNIKYDNLVGIEVTCSNKNIKTTDITKSRENVVISVEDASTEQFNVLVNTSTGKVAEGYMIGTAVPEQGLIQISGPASVIAKIKRVEVELNVTGVNSDRTMHGKLNVLDSDGEEVDTTYLEYTGKTEGMDVTVTVLRTKTVPLKIGYTGTPADGYSFSSISYKPETIQIAGAATDIARISSITIPDEAIDIEGISENLQQTLDISEYLPDGIRLADENDASVSVSVEIEKKQGKTVSIPVSSIGIQNAPRGYEVDFGDTDEVQIIVTGTSAELAALDTSAITASLDLSSHTRAGTYTETLKVSFPDSAYSLLQEVEVTFDLVKSTHSGNTGNTGNGGSSSGGTTGDSDKSDTSGGTGSDTTGGNSGGSAGDDKEDSKTE